MIGSAYRVRSGVLSYVAENLLTKATLVQHITPVFGLTFLIRSVLSMTVVLRESQLCSISDDAWAPKGLSTGLWTEVGDGNTSLRRLVEGQRRSCFAQHLVSRSLCNAEVDDVSTPLSRLA
ncbi:hypothetical protein PMIN02_009510 [Paraphaeosphaeria minitans]